MSGASSARLSDGRLHLQHGPIDVLVELFGAASEVETGYAQAAARFGSILPGLVMELPLLRQSLNGSHPLVRDPVAQAMLRAVWPHRRTFVTPMAAVAGAVADTVLAAAVAGRRLERGYANNGGDIALYLVAGESFDAGVVDRIDRPSIDARVRIDAAHAIGGIATSGWRGRSHSLGIADAVTVLAGNAAEADVAATLIANAISIDSPAVERRAASELDPDSDLGALPVTVAVGSLAPSEVAAALSSGQARAVEMRDAGLIRAAYLSLAGAVRTVGSLSPALPQQARREA